MKKTILFAAAFVALLVAGGCQTVETLKAPPDAYNIRKPADTTKPVSQTETTIIEVK